MAVRIAVVGMGSIGLRHARNLKTLGYTNIRGWDIDPAKGDPIDWSWKPEVVLICTPPDSHTQLAINAIHAGVKGLFVEKPLSDRLGAAEDTLIRLADEAKVVTMVGCNWRFAKPVSNLLSRGPERLWLIAEIPARHIMSPAGALWDAGIHLVDLAVWQNGPAKWDLRHCSPFNFSVYLEHEAGQRSHISAVTNAAEYRFVVAELSDRKGITRWRWKGKDSIWPWGFKVNQMYMDELRHFMHCVKAGEPTGNDFGFAAETLRIALGVRDG